VDAAAEILDGLTAVVNAAGVLRGGGAGDVTVENYDFNMNTNTRASFEIMTWAIPYLKDAAAAAVGSSSIESNKNDEEMDVSFKPKVSPSIINISSVNGKQSFPGCISYCMSKAAVDMMTKCASVDLAKYGVRVNSVNPGMVVTDLQKVRTMQSSFSTRSKLTFIKNKISFTKPSHREEVSPTNNIKTS
jgi:NAD(P)-dependent dehydrogenase (short-subunit alcohol dehydrogenase family)